VTYSGMFSVNMTPLPFSDKTGLEEEQDKSSNEGQGYCFIYPVPEKKEAGPLDLEALPARHLRSLLNLLTPTWKGEPVRIDGYQFLSNPGCIHPLYETVSNSEPDDPLTELYEPRLTYIQGLIKSLLAVVHFEYQGQEQPIDGLRLKRPDQWLRPGGGAADILAQAASRCNLKCRFCLNLGSPPAFQTTPRPAKEEYQEILARIEHYVPGSKQGLLPIMGSPGEMLSHPHILEILAALRKKTDELIRIPSNGSLLTPEMIQALARFQPLFIDVSLNSSSPIRRRWLMGDPHPETAIAALAGLKASRIPYSVVIVPWPFPTIEEMSEDLERTVAFASQFDPAFQQISLPGYSDRFSREKLFDRETVWNRVKEEIVRLRTIVDCPLILRPGIFEEYLDPEAVDAPMLIGLVKNSPAARAGLLSGDCLLDINGLPVQNRPQARSLLGIIHNSRLEQVSITVGRAEGRKMFTIGLKNSDYPYDWRSVPMVGCVFPSSGVPLDWTEFLGNRLSRIPAREILILTSALIRPTLEKRIRDNLFLPGTTLHLRVPPNRYLGGNIFMGDLLVVEDFITAIKDFLDEGLGRPDLVVIPSSPFRLSGWGRDLTGRVYKDIERITGIPVELMECDPIFD
jgi:pyruvate-formate lyase-activating enzyme